jgi:hypothetical protein
MFKETLKLWWLHIVFLHKNYTVGELCEAKSHEDQEKFQNPNFSSAFWNHTEYIVALAKYWISKYIDL